MSTLPYSLRSLLLALFLLGSGVSAHAEPDLVEIVSSRHLVWEAEPSATLYEIQATPKLAPTSGWITVGTVAPTGMVMSTRLNITNDVAFYRVTAVTSTFPQTRHEMNLIPEATFLMGNPFDHLNVPVRLEGFTNEVPVHPVPVSSFLMDKYEVTYEKVLEVFNWAYDQGLIAVQDVTNATGGVVVANGRVVNTEGVSYRLAEVNTQFNDMRFTNGIFSLLNSSRMKHPALFLTWYGGMAYGNYRSDMEGLSRAVDFGVTNWAMDLDANGYRLPTEAEWEKAARGGIAGTHYPWPNDSVQGTNDYLWNIDPVKANYIDFRWVLGVPTNFNPITALTNHPAHPWFQTNIFLMGIPPYGTTPVGYYNGYQQIAFGSMTNENTNVKRGADFAVTQDMANAYGLYDMAGNVYEWCYDRYYESWYLDPSSSTPNTKGFQTNSITGARVVRGGGWIPITLLGEVVVSSDPSYLRCSYRGHAHPPGFPLPIGLPGVLPGGVHQALGFRTVRSVR